MFECFGVELILYPELILTCLNVLELIDFVSTVIEHKSLYSQLTYSQNQYIKNKFLHRRSKHTLRLVFAS